MKLLIRPITFLLLAGCVSCAAPDHNKMKAEESLYQAIGQMPAIDKLIDNLVNIIGQDDVVFSHFAQSNVTHFKEKLTLFLCHITDGPCEYKGDTMEDIHRGMHINKNQFNHFVELFIAAMDASNISYPVQNKLLARLAPLRKNIIKI